VAVIYVMKTVSAEVTGLYSVSAVYVVGAFPCREPLPATNVASRVIVVVA